MMPTAQVGRQVVRPFTQSAQINDPLDTNFSRGPSKVFRRLTIALLESSLSAAHRMNQVVCGPTTIESRIQRAAIEHITGHDLNSIAPAASGDFPRVSCQAPNGVSVRNQLRYETATDVTAGARDEYELSHAEVSDYNPSPTGEGAETQPLCRFQRPNARNHSSLSNLDLLSYSRRTRPAGKPGGLDDQRAPLGLATACWGTCKKRRETAPGSR